MTRKEYELVFQAFKNYRLYMTDYVNKLSPVEFFEEGYNYWEDDFDEIVEDFKGGQSENNLN